MNAENDVDQQGPMPDSKRGAGKRTAEPPEPVEAKIRQWVVNSGRDIELAVARDARLAGATAVHSIPYIDPVERKLREADVLAEFDGLGGSGVPVTLVVECRRAVGKHWVTFPYDFGRISSQPIVDHTLVVGTNVSGRAQKLQQAWNRNDSIFRSEPTISTALVEAEFTLGKAEKDTSKDTAADALRQCWSAALGISMERPRNALVDRVIVPVLVSLAQLWTCRLPDDGAPFVIERADYARVRAPQVKTGVLIHVMNLTRFAAFAQQIADLQKASRP